MASESLPNSSTVARAVIYRGGPGAGKTALLVHTAREALHTALSLFAFSAYPLDQAAAEELQQRFLEAAMAEESGAVPQVLTYERLARLILAEASGQAAPRFLDPLTERLLVGRALEETGPHARYFRDLVRFSPRFRDEVADFIAELKRHKITPERFRDELAPGLPEAEALGDLAAAYQRYQELLQREQVYDLRGLLWLALEALQDPPRRQAWARRYTLVLADDLQEATPLHLELLAALTGPHTELVGFYEPAETIYGFRGALGDPHTLLAALLDRPLEEAPLGDSPGALAQSVAAVAERFRQAEALESAPLGVGALGGAVSYAAYRTREDEFSAIGDELVACLESGECPPGELAVITRTREAAQAAAEYLTLRGLPITGAEETGHWQARQVLSDLLVVVTREQPTASGPGARLAQAQAAAEALGRLADLTADASERRRLPQLCRAEYPWRAPADAYPSLAAWREALATVAGAPLLEALPPLAAHLLRRIVPEAWSRLAGPIAALLDQMKQSGDWLVRLTGHPMSLAEAEVILASAPLRLAFQRPDVAVLTAHESRGRRFRRVFLACLEEEDFPKPPEVARLLSPSAARALRERLRHVLRLPAQVAIFAGLGEAPSEALAEERRLFYVCLTRASERLRLSCHLESSGAPLLPSPFFSASLPPDFRLAEGAAAGGFDCIFAGLVPEAAEARREHALCPVSPCCYARELSVPQPLPAPETVPRAVSSEPVLAELAASLRLAPTHLEKYLRCPRWYFLADILRVLPDRDTDQRTHGEAIHHFLRRLNSALPAERTEAAARHWLREALAEYRDRFSFPLAADMYGRLGEAALAIFLQSGGAEAETRLPEGEVRFSLADPTGQRHLFGGRLDVAVQRGEGMEVVDYKTGEVESAATLRKSIPLEAGAARSIKKLQLQLPFYALAWEAQEDARPVVGMCLQNFSVKHRCRRYCVSLGTGTKETETLSREDLRKFAGLLVQWAREIKSRREFDGFAPEEGCKPRISACPFAEVCDAAELF